jgi:HK97 family phage portal protein
VLTGRASNYGEGWGPDSPRGRRANAGQTVNQNTALKNSVWWAGLVLRANLVSTFPVDVVRLGSDGLLVPIKNPGQLVSEPYPNVDITEFLFSTQMDKDRYGNAVGIIRERNALGLPITVELQNMATCSAIMNGPAVQQWRCGNDYYNPRDIWHEKQYTMAGLGLGLSVLGYAAHTMGIYASTQEFALQWFGNGALPRGTLKNTVRPKLDPKVADEARERFKAATQDGDIFVHGQEWEWTPATTSAQSSGFLDQKASSERDVARYVGVPGGMLDVEISTGNITYANVTQANLQFLVTQLGPSVIRTERYWSAKALPKPWQMKLNTDALMRMDPMSKAQLMGLLIDKKVRTPTEVRRLDNLAPYTPEQLAELGTFASMGKPAPAGPVQKESTPWLVPS